MGAVNGGVSFWWSDAGQRGQRPSLTGSADADVCIVGAGFTGLWTAYYLAHAEPSLRITVLEERYAGFGASGRNGGWLTNSVTGGLEQYVDSHGRDAAVRQQLAMNAAVDEVIRVAGVEGIDARIRAGGELVIARNRAQLQRVEDDLRAAAAWPATGWQPLDAEGVHRRIAVSGALGGMWQPHCATLHPARLVAGLATAVEALGVTIHEGTRVDRIEPRVVHAATGVVRAPAIIRATEGFTARLSGQRRTWLPMNSSLVITDPLPPAAWDEIGWGGHEALGDAAHVYMYAQRTADDRIALGGRGVPYRYGSGIDADGATPDVTVDSLTRLVHEFFPAARDVLIAHAWSGVLGVPRDWSATVAFDPVTGLGHAGGYVGTGVTATNLAGRTLRDLVLGEQTELTTLPWVGHRARRWEPEPLRWLGVSSLYAAYRAADHREGRGAARTSRLARAANVVAGR